MPIREYVSKWLYKKTLGEIYSTNPEVRCFVFLHKAYAKLYHELSKLLGYNLSNFTLYKAGNAMAYDTFSFLKNYILNTSTRKLKSDEIIKISLEDWMLGYSWNGWGIYKIVEYKPKKYLIVVAKTFEGITYRQLLNQETDMPVCALSLGTLAGAFRNAFNLTKVTAYELMCRAKGDPIDLFIVCSREVCMKDIIKKIETKDIENLVPEKLEFKVRLTPMDERFKKDTEEWLKKYKIDYNTGFAYFDSNSFFTLGQDSLLYIIEAIRKRLRSISSKVLYRIGYEMASEYLNVAQIFKETHGDYRVVKHIFAWVGFGCIEFRNRDKIILKNSIIAEAYKKVYKKMDIGKKTYCELIAGLLHGLLGNFVKNIKEITEIKCKISGENYCEFQLCF